MYRQKKQNPWKRVLALSLFCLVMDFLMLGIFSARPVHYVIALVSQAPLLVICCAALTSVMVGALMNGLVVYEIAWTVLLGLLGRFLLQRTIALSFAQSVLVAFLMGIFMLGAIFLNGVPQPCFMMGVWTFFQIIANIIIVNLLLKYTS